MNAKSENSSGHEADDQGENKSILALPADDDEKDGNQIVDQQFLW